MMSLTFRRAVETDFNLPQYSCILLIAMMGASVTILMPLLVGAFTDSGLFSTTQVGYLASAEIAGILISSASAYLWVRRIPWRSWTQLSLLAFIACNLATSWIVTYELVVLLRFVAGLACGVSYAIALAALGDQSRVDKAFGVMVTIQVIFGTAGFALLPYVIGPFGYAGIYQCFNLFLLMAFVLSFFSFPTNQKPQKAFRIDLHGRWLAAGLVFAGTIAYYFAQGTVWAYLERIGVNAGLSVAEVGAILGVGFAISAIGSMMSSWFVSHIGRNRSLIITAAVQLPCLAALYWLSEGNAWLVYAIATIIYQVFWSFIVPIMMAIFNDVDKSGRLIVFCVTAFKIGLVLGPPAAAFTIGIASLNEVLWLGAVAIVVSVTCLMASNRLLQR